MFLQLRRHFGAAGLVVAIVALVAALTGGAIAATGGSDGSKATASAKGKPGPRGKTGKTGPAGPAGPQGPAGANGRDGADGLDGLDGAKGATGATGPTGLTGAQGDDGTDGTDGAPGLPGSPWTVGGVLPPGKTETGTWSFGAITADPGFNPILVPISFPIPLAADLGEAEVHYLNAAGEEGGQPSTQCLGSAADPKAKPGHLCLYTGDAVGSFLISNESIGKASSTQAGASKAGAVITVVIPEVGSYSRGAWAVTAPE